MLGARVSKLFEIIVARRLKAVTPPDGTFSSSICIGIPCILIFVGLILITKLTDPNTGMTTKEGFQGNSLNKTDCKFCPNLTGFLLPEAYKRFQHYKISGKANTGNSKKMTEYTHEKRIQEGLGKIPGKSTALPPLSYTGIYDKDGERIVSAGDQYVNSNSLSLREKQP